jgi:ketosteroid isomerase-like protein
LGYWYVGDKQKKTIQTIIKMYLKIILLASLSLLACSRLVGQSKHTPADDALEIANLQGRYLHCMNSNQLDLIPSFFAQNDSDVTLDLPDNRSGIPIKGIAAIREEFLKLKGMVTSQGGFMGTHLATTPVIIVDKEGKLAHGSWMSQGFTVMGPAFAFAFGGKTPTPPYQTLPVVGRYEHTFVKEKNVWKFKQFKWSIFVSLPPFSFDPAKTGPGWANTPMQPGTKIKDWPLSPADTINFSSQKSNKMQDIFLAYVEAINQGNLDAAMSLFAPDAQLINSKYRPVIPAEGYELVKAYIAETVIGQNGQIKILKINEEGNEVNALIELTSNRIKQAGQNRILGTERMTIVNNKIKVFDFSMDLNDVETKKFFEFVRKLEENRAKK